MRQRPPFIAVGIDPAINHTGIVAIDQDMRLVDWRYQHTVKKAIQEGYGSLVPHRKKGEDADCFEIRRLDAVAEQYERDVAWSRGLAAVPRATWQEMIIPFEVRSSVPLYVGIEDYALDQKAGAHQLGQNGGPLRLAFYRRHLPMRLHGPKTIKMFITGNGNAEPEDVAIHVEQWYPHAVRTWMELHKEVWLDLVVAAALARFIATEVLLREGVLKLESLSEKQRNTFLRVTKKGDVNILGKPWILKESE